MLEVSTIKERPLQSLSGLSVNPFAQRVGFSDPDRYRVERDRSLAILKGKTTLLKVASDYQVSYGLTNTPTVIRYRDYILSKAIQTSLVNTQLIGQDLTEHAKKAWLYYAFDNIWDYIPTTGYADAGIVYPTFWGPLGSPVYYSYYTSDSNPIRTLKNIYVWFWATLGQSVQKSPRDRLATLIDSIGLDDTLLEYVNSLEVTAEQTYALRRAGLVNKPRSLKQLFLLGEYNDSYFSTLLADAPPKIREAYRTLTLNILSVAKPAGFRLVAQMLKLEAYLEIADLLTELPADIHNLQLQSFLGSSDYLSIKYQITEYFALANDCIIMQDWFTTTILDLVNLRMWLKASKESEVPVLSKYRLSSFA